MNIILWDLQHPIPSFGNALKTVYSSRFRVRLIICILNTIYWLLFSTISEKIREDYKWEARDNAG